LERAYAWLYHRLGRRYAIAVVAIELVSALLITLGTLGIFRLYVDSSGAQFLRILLFAEACVAVGIAVGLWTVRKAERPLWLWLRGRREGLDPTEVWREAVAFPLEFIRRSDKLSALVVALPVSVFAVAELGLPFYSVVFLMLGGFVSIAYAAVLHFFAAEVALRPVVLELSEQLPDGFSAHRVGVPLRWKLLGSLPLINVITGVVVSGLSADQRAGLEDLGLSVLAAVIVAFTISLELTLLVSRSVLRPVRDLLSATERVKAGDYSARVPVVSGDELGTLALSFNEMMSGLREREALHEAFSSYVDPQVAARVLEEGARLEGEDVEVTIVFVDVRDFTSFAEGASAEETVAYVNRFLELVVPILTKHGGHANKFVGDGVLGVFGAPVRLADHAGSAVTAAREIGREAEQRFGDRMRIGIGVNSGPVLAGTIGGGGKLEFTVIGDAVNVAARVEEVTRSTGDTALITEATRALLSGEDAITLEPRGAIPLKGRREPVPIYAVVDERGRTVQTLRGASPGVTTG
jgi:adenylate cyclase